MYHDSILENQSNTESNQVQVQRLKANIAELKDIMELAIREDNYALEDSTRTKLRAMKSQLEQLQDSFLSEVLMNFVTEWQSKLAEILPFYLYQRDQSILALKESFQATFRKVIDIIPLYYHDAIVRSLIIILPTEATSLLHSYGWDFFAKNIKYYDPQNADQVDFIKSLAYLLLVDVIAKSLEGLDTKQVKRDTIYSLLTNGILFIRNNYSKKTNFDYQQSIYQATVVRWSLIFGELAKLERLEFYRQISAFFEKSKKITPEEINQILFSMKYVFGKPKDSFSSSSYIGLMNEILNFFSKNKKIQFKIQAINTLEKMVSTLSYSVVEAELRGDDVDIWKNVAKLHQQARKWVTISDLTSCSLQLICAILINGPTDYFHAHLEPFLQADVLAGKKMKLHAYEAILSILRGKYQIDSLDYSWKLFYHTYEPGMAFSFLMRPKSELDPTSAAERLDSISDILFLTRTSPIEFECLDVCAEIIAQMAAYSLEYGSKLIARLLDTNLDVGNIDLIYVAIKAYRIITDTECGFFKRAACSTDDQFSDLYGGLASLFEPRILKVFDLINSLVGIEILGVSKNIFYPVLLGKNNQREALEFRTDLHDPDIFSTLFRELRALTGVGIGFKTVGDAFSKCSSGRDSEISVNKYEKREYLSETDIDKNIEFFLNDWRISSDSKTLNAEDFLVVPPVGEKPVVAPSSFRKDENVILCTFEELIKLIPTNPYNDFLKGTYFIGKLFCHSNSIVQTAASISLQKLIKLNPKHRLTYLQGFLNYFGKDPLLDDKSIINILLQLLALLKDWAEGDVEASSFRADVIKKTSSKLDALMLIFLGRVDSRIRKICLLILVYCEKIFSVIMGTKEFSLISIIHKMENRIIKDSITSLSNDHLSPFSLSASVISGLEAVDFFEVACSNYVHLYRYYYGSLAAIFAEFGDIRSICHLSKYLSTIALPGLQKQPTSINSILNASNAAIMLLAFAGAPENLEVNYGMKSVGDDVAYLLYEKYRGQVIQIFGSNSNVLCTPFTLASCYTHPAIRQLYIYDLYSSIQQDSGILSIYENILPALNQISHANDFSSLIEEESVCRGESTLEIYFKVLHEFSRLFDDYSFIIRGPRSKMRAAVSFVSILKRLAILNPTGKMQIALIKMYWTAEFLQFAISKIFQWDTILMDMNAPVEVISDPEFGILRSRLSSEIVLAFRWILNSKKLLYGGEMPIEITNWLINLEKRDDKSGISTPVYLYENTISYVLAEAYGQLLPNMSEISQKNSHSKVNFAMVQMLYPQKLSSLDYPSYTTSELERLRKHLGSLLFAGLYYMLHHDKLIRSQSFLFVKRLFELFGESVTFKTEAYFSEFYGAIFSNLSLPLENAIIGISEKAAELFASEAPSFLFEAVRCSRCMATDNVLIATQRWIMQVMLPWCHLIKLDKVHNDNFQEELFRYLLDMAFFDSQFIEKIADCWTDACKNKECGGLNGMILTDAMVYISALIEGVSRRQCVHLVSSLVQNSIDIVRVLVYHITPSALPWNQDSLDTTPFGKYSPNQRQAKSLIKDYSINLCSDLEISIPESINDYTVSSRSAGFLISELLVQEFSLMLPCIASILTYVLLHLSPVLNHSEESPPLTIFKNMIEGFIGFLHSSSSLDLEAFKASKTKISELMKWFATTGGKLDFDRRKIGDNDLESQSSLHIMKLLETMDIIFSPMIRNIKSELLLEVILWASEGFVSPNISLKAINMSYALVLLGKPLYYNFLNSRILDQLSILKNLSKELQVSDGKWGQLPEGKLEVKNSAVQIVVSVLHYHQAIISKTSISLISKIKSLFWVSIGLLKLSFYDFPEIYSTALKTLEVFLLKGQDGLMKQDDITEESISAIFPGILKTVLKSLFRGTFNVQQRSFSVLIVSWTSLPDKFTDSSKTGTFYTHIYSALWIIAKCSTLKSTQASGYTADVLSVMKKFKYLLSNHRTGGISSVVHSLMGNDSDNIGSLMDSIMGGIDSNIAVPVNDDRIHRFLLAIYRMHLPEYISNLTEFLIQAFSFDSEFRPAVVQMIVSLWIFNRKIDTSKKIRLAIESLIQKLPFLCKDKEFEEIFPGIFSAAYHASIKDVDLTIRNPSPIFPGQSGSPGSIQEAGDWLNSLDIKSSNKFFVWS